MRTKYKHTQGLTLDDNGTTWETTHLSQAGCEEPGQLYCRQGLYATDPRILRERLNHKDGSNSP